MSKTISTNDPSRTKRLSDAVRRASISTPRYLGSINEPFFSKHEAFLAAHRGPRFRKKKKKILSPEELYMQRENLWKLMSSYLSVQPRDISQYIVNHIEYTLARSRTNFNDFAAYQACAYSVRDRLIEFWNDAQQLIIDKNKKKVYYLSIEYLMGRSLQNGINNLGLFDPYHEALLNLGYELESLYELEQDAALGNGGLGRLASCYLDSLATLNYPSWGYGLRYQYGMFKQSIQDGYQIETPDFWLGHGNPWEISRTDIIYNVKFNGNVRMIENCKFVWENYDLVSAKAYDNPIPGYGTKHVANLRLWESLPCQDDDYRPIYQGDYYRALEKKRFAESITSILYPNDTTKVGYELRLRQEYFFVSASLQDIIERYKFVYGNDLSNIYEKTAIQLNDTHPSLAIVEFLRILVDEENFEWDKAWDIVTKTFSFTNHTILPEANELWELPIFEKLLPRHILLIYEINERFLRLVDQIFPHNRDEMRRRLSIIEESYPKKIRMSHICIIGSHTVNGVAEIHTKILKTKMFKDFATVWPEKFICVSNGATPRRWIDQANPSLSNLVSEKVGDDTWLVSLEKIKVLRKYIDDVSFREKFYNIKQANKLKLANYIAGNYDIQINTNFMFDIQVKRIHEYKRQLMNILSVIWRYHLIKTMSPHDRSKVVPRVIIFAGKAAPGYRKAKLVIKLINEVSNVVNGDKELEDCLKVIYLENYNVSLAELIIPAADLSQHISTAGTEASGTSNMKFCMNGSLIIGTYDGANIEIMEEAGKENMFLFGSKFEEVDSIRERGPKQICNQLNTVINLITSGKFGDYSIYRDIIEDIRAGNDYYLISHEFESYLNAQAEVDRQWKNKEEWISKCIYTTSSMGKFSSDRSIEQYAQKIWKLEKCDFGI